MTEPRIYVAGHRGMVGAANRPNVAEGGAEPLDCGAPMRNWIY